MGRASEYIKRKGSGISRTRRYLEDRGISVDTGSPMPANAASRKDAKALLRETGSAFTPESKQSKVAGVGALKGIATGGNEDSAQIRQLETEKLKLENDYNFLQGFEQDWTGEPLYEGESGSALAGKELEKVKREIAEEERRSDTRLQRGMSAGFGGTGKAGGSFRGGRAGGGGGRAGASEDPLDGTMDTGRLKLELEAAQKRQQQAQRQYNLYIDDGAGSAYASLSPETRKALSDELNAANEAVKTLTRQLEQAAYLNGYRDVVYEEDNFWNQAMANYQLGRIGQDANAAFSTYLADPTEANLNYANALQGLEEQFQRNNQLVLDDEGAKLPWLSKSAANYLPQFIDRTKAQIGWGTVGAFGGLAVGSPVLGAKAGITAASGLQSVTQMEGAAYRALINAGVDEETAREAARDEALISSLIEMGDTAFDIATLGGNKALARLGKAAVKSGSKSRVVKELGKFALNVAGEGLEEGVQQGVSIANQRRAESGIGDLISRTMDTLGDALSGRDEEARKEILDAGKEGLKIALMFGGAGKAVDAAVSLKQAWDAAMMEKLPVENRREQGYNDDTNGARVSDAEIERNIQGYVKDIIDSSGAVDVAKMKELGSAIQDGIFTAKEISAISKKMSDLGITEEYETAMKSINFGVYLKNVVGPPPKDMIQPHAHHILFKTGIGPVQKQLAKKGQAILRRNGIDPIVGPENLVWAPMYAKDQHSLASLKKLVDALEAAEDDGGGYEELSEILQDFGEIAGCRK